MTKRDGLMIYGWLVALTLAEVAIVGAGVGRAVGVILMAGTTAAKLTMIGGFFMHMKHDRPIAWLLPAVPLLLAVLFVAALFPDLVYHLPLRFQ
jgi:heme/copper-type cytochrome/quinol oxidase subunit 4